MKNTIKKILQKLRRLDYIVLYKHYCRKCKLNENNVLFLSSSRDTLSGNSYFVYEEIKKRKKYHIETMLKKSLNNKYSFAEKKRMTKLIASSKYVFIDDFYPIIYALKLRKGTELIQLWHAMGAYKKVGYSRNANPKSYTLTHRNYTGAIVSSEQIRKNYAEAFGIDISKVQALGVPRTDIFFDKKYKEEIKKSLYKKYPVLKNKKIILFAPTFRGNNINDGYYDFSKFDFEDFSKQLSKDYICIYKMHPFINNHPDYDIKKDKFYLDLTSEREVNNLLFITDVLLTDYSSVIFEYSFFKKPVVFFMPDLEDYKNSRDFFYPLDNYTYGPIVTDYKDLVNTIKEEKIDLKKIEKFDNFFCSACDGKSTKRVVDYYLKGR